MPAAADAVASIGSGVAKPALVPAVHVEAAAAGTAAVWLSMDVKGAMCVRRCLVYYPMHAVQAP